MPRPTRSGPDRYTSLACTKDHKSKTGRPSEDHLTSERAARQFAAKGVISSTAEHHRAADEFDSACVDLSAATEVIEGCAAMRTRAGSKSSVASRDTCARLLTFCRRLLPSLQRLSG
jgi:hypothetical protein